MTTYLITEAQRDKQYAALENSIDAVTQEITNHKTMWGEEAIPSRAAQRQNLVLKEREHKDAMEMLQSLPMVDSEPVEYLLDGMRIKLNFNSVGNITSLQNLKHDLQGRWVSFVGAENDKHLKATSPQALTQISADDVTDEMIHNWHANTFGDQAMGGVTDRDMIVAAYNAVIRHRSEAK